MRMHKQEHRMCACLCLTSSCPTTTRGGVLNSAIKIPVRFQTTSSVEEALKKSKLTVLKKQ